MTTPRHSDFAAAPSARLFHTSTRTQMSTNIDPTTGLRTRLLATSSIEMAWQSGELLLRGRVTRTKLVDRGDMRPMPRWRRGEQ
ncbi:hypothetical protein AVHY2522_24665 [Acidovorax sp. SUPP2522]|uniref:hypothetical protein n=1 Tax=unclassified Acidovorax TaxID=2684926 RepID=UPI00234946C9|nr:MULTISPECIES: hypothetical protein [unclassified Acidovorax]WCM96252.1 hypothetical protein M5C96_17675 [Acidovorax sp. GBBC 1281]GKT20055.1 hypothetical protein AVHY2522_24665 [Acidovorax sp. SUPP2522]